MVYHPSIKKEMSLLLDESKINSALSIPVSPRDGHEVEREVRFGNSVTKGTSRSFDSDIGVKLYNKFRKAALELLSSETSSHEETSLMTIFKKGKVPYRRVEVIEKSPPSKSVSFQRKETISIQDEDFSLFSIRSSVNVEIKITRAEWESAKDDKTVRERVREVFPTKTGALIHLTKIKTITLDGVDLLVPFISYEAEVEFSLSREEKMVNSIPILSSIINRVYTTNGSILPPVSIINDLISEYKKVLLTHSDKSSQKQIIRPNKIIDIDPDRFSSVVTSMQASPFEFSYKLDGVRFSVLDTSSFVCLVNPYATLEGRDLAGKRISKGFSGEDFLIYRKELPSKRSYPTSLFEGELFKEDVYLFDTLVYKGKNETGKNAVDRLKLRELSDKVTNLSIILKTFSYELFGKEDRYSVFGYMKMLRYMYENHNTGDVVMESKDKLYQLRSDFIEHNDGLVCMKNDSYDTKEAYKIKFPWRVSVDFKVLITKKNEDSVTLKLFTQGKEGKSLPFVYKNIITEESEFTYKKEDYRGVFNDLETDNIIEFYWERKTLRGKKETVLHPYPVLWRKDKSNANFYEVVGKIMKNIETPTMFETLTFSLLKNETRRLAKESKTLTEDLVIGFNIAKLIDLYTIKKLGLSIQDVEDIKARLTGAVIKSKDVKSDVKKDERKVKEPEDEKKDPKKERLSVEVKNVLQIDTMKDGKFMSDEERSKMIDEERESKGPRRGTGFRNFRDFQNSMKQRVIDKVFSMEKEKNRTDRLYNLGDIGFGNAGDVWKYKKHFGSFGELIGVEPNPDHVKEAKRRLNSDQNDPLRMKQIANNIIQTGIEDVRNIIPRWKPTGRKTMKFVSSFFSLSFMFGSIESLNSLVRVLNETVMVGGYFFGTYMDGTIVNSLLDIIDPVTKEKVTGRTAKGEVFERPVWEQKLTFLNTASLTKKGSITEKDERAAIGGLFNEGFGVPIRIKMDMASIREQTEYLVIFSILKKKLEAVGFNVVENSQFPLQEEKNPSLLLTRDESKFSRMNKSFIFYRAWDPELELSDLREGEQEEMENNIDPRTKLVRVAVDRYGSCFFDSILTGINSAGDPFGFRSSSKKERKEEMRRFRLKIASKLTQNKYERGPTGFEQEFGTNLIEWIDSGDDQLDEKISKIVGKEFSKDKVDYDAMFDSIKESSKTIKLKRSDIDRIREKLYDKFKEDIENIECWAEDSMFNFVMEAMGYNLLIISDRSRSPIRIVETTRDASYLVFLNIGNKHFEPIAEETLNLSTMKTRLVFEFSGSSRLISTARKMLSS